MKTTSLEFKFHKDVYLKLISKILFLGLFIFAIISFFYKIYQEQNTYSKIAKNTFKSEKVINEIRQNSENLTRLARLYTNTKDTLYRNQYFEILNIRKGTSPRPQHFNRVYWSLLTTKNHQEPPFIKKIKNSTSKLIATAGFTKQEGEIITQAVNYSLTLTHLEIAAFYILDGNQKGKQVYDAILNQKTAIELVNSEHYHSQTTLIMIELNKAYELIELRTNTERSNLEHKIKRIIILASIALILIIVTIGLIIRSALQLKKETILHLKTTVENRTKELRKSLFINKKITKDLQELNISKDLFFSIIAHDLKGPFNSLIGFSNLLLEDQTVLEDPEVRESVEIIKNVSQNTFNLLQNLLEWTQVQKGSLPFEPKNIRISEAFNTVLQVLKYQSMHKGIELKTALQNNHLEVFADKDMLNTILRNLISNAIKYSHKNSRIELSCTNTNNELIIKISDNGIGISKERIATLFNYEYIHKTTGTHGEKGTGLGLILTKDFIEKHQGRIWVESVLKKGTSFNFTLPNQKKPSTI